MGISLGSTNIRQDDHEDVVRETIPWMLLPRADDFQLSYQRLLYQTKYDIIPYEIAKPLAVALFGFGQLFVLTSTYDLGITGTYLGDYFGILMDHRVEGFPFNIMRDSVRPCASWELLSAGLVLSGLVYIVYSVALKYEGPFTDMIYSKRAGKSQ